jgi:pyruvate dehydrogenase E1 component
MVENYSDEQLQKLNRGGHDPKKVYNAYKTAVDHQDEPVVILAQTIKGYGLGEAGEGRNITHQQKKLNEQELLHFRSRFGIPLSDEEAKKAPFFKPPDDSEEMQYLKKRRESLGGYLPKRNSEAEPDKLPDDSIYNELLEGSGDRELATTMSMVGLMGKMMADKNMGKRVVPLSLMNHVPLVWMPFSASLEFIRIPGRIMNRWTGTVCFIIKRPLTAQFLKRE